MIVLGFVYAQLGFYSLVSSPYVDKKPALSINLYLRHHQGCQESFF